MKRICSILIIIFALLFVFVNTNDVFAVNPNTNKINFYLRHFDEQAYSWSQYRDSGFEHAFTGVAAVRQYGIQYENIFTTGNYASLHFETNLVSVTEVRSNPENAFRWLNLDRIVVKHCTFNGSPLTIETNNVDNVITTWWQDAGDDTWLYSSTLTLYGDVTLSGIPSNTAGTFVCDVGTDINYDYFWSNESTGSYIYWEKNPSNLIFGSNLNDALLQTQINQNTTIINNQEEIKDWLTDDTQPNVDTSGLSGASGWLPPGPVDSVLTLPITLGQNVVNIFTGQNQCRPIVLPFDFLGAGTSLSIPCLSTYLSDAGASTIWNTVGLVISAFMYYYTLRWLYKFIDDTLTLRENSSTMWGGL